jgi:hypothetical protein
MLNSLSDVDMHHEYMIHHLQPAGVMYFHNKMSEEDVVALINRTYGSAITLSKYAYWGDCSNKASWFIEELALRFKHAKFVHLVRDGRKVTSSLFHKLGHECLDDESVCVLKQYLFAGEDQASVCPPPEKKYWWPLVNADSDDWETYFQLDHFGRIAYHWKQINERIQRSLEQLDRSRFVRVRLEDLTEHRTSFDELMAFLGLESGDQTYELIKKPFNVIRPENNPLDEKQSEVFWHYCADLMNTFGYSSMDEYLLDYKSGGYL